MTTYFANPSTVADEPMRAGLIAYIDTPRQGNKRPAGVRWCADNGCFSDKFDEPAWWAWLVANAGDAADCSFAVAPDVVGDAVATLERSRPWLAKIRDLGYPVAFVAQDGIEETVIPWDEFDALFVGGSTEFKLGEVALEVILQAKRRGKYVHVGRVNSRKRFLAFAELEVDGEPAVDSVDGTFVTYAPKQNIHRLLSWVHELAGDAERSYWHKAAAKREAMLAAARKAAAVADDERIAQAAQTHGWTAAPARAATGYVRGDETLAVVFSDADRALHATRARYTGDELIGRASQAPDAVGFALATLASSQVADLRK
jgi:hypothetical protein